MALGGATIRPNPTGLLILFVVFIIFVFYVNSGSKWWRTDPQVSLKELLSVSIDLAASGGSRVRKIQERALKESKGFRKEAALKAKSKGKTDEGAEQLVTDGDLNSHRSIVYGFNKAFPGLHLISEEHDIKPPDFNAIPMPSKKLAEVSEISDEKVAMSAVTVWIDPLDATHEYSLMRKDQNEYVTVMICVAVHGRPVIGVVHQPFLPPIVRESSTSTNGGSSSSTLNAGTQARDSAAQDDNESAGFGRTFWAWVKKRSNFEVPSDAAGDPAAAAAAGSQGISKLYPPHARAEDSPDKSSSSSDHPLPRVIISQSHTGEAVPALNMSLGNVTVIKAGGAGYKTLAVIQKKADLYYHHTKIKKWDICAGDALISAVGGSMTTLSGDLVDYSSSYDLSKTEKVVDGKLVVALDDKHEYYRSKLAHGVPEFEKWKKSTKSAKTS